MLPRKYAEPLSGVRGTPPHGISATICHSSTRRPAFRACVQSFVRPLPRAQSLSTSSGKIFGLNSVERNIIGTKHGQTMEVPGGLWMNIDLHNLERLIGIEILAPTSEMVARLNELSEAYR